MFHYAKDIILSLSQLSMMNDRVFFIQEPSEIGDKKALVHEDFITEVWNGTPAMSKQHPQNTDHLTPKKPGKGRSVTPHLPSNKIHLIQPFLAICGSCNRFSAGFPAVFRQISGGILVFRRFPALFAVSFPPHENPRWRRKRK